MILHIDADAFFASCEQAMNPKLLNVPVVVGKERGIATAFSYDAKKLGVTRGMPIYKVEKQFPQIKIVAGNFRAYGAFSKKMFAILRRYTNLVEVYGADEGFVDLRNTQKYLKMSPGETAEQIQKAVRKEVNIPVSIGVGPTKTLAKIGSRWNKPEGICVIQPSEVVGFLKRVPIEDVWGVGRQLTKKMIGLQIHSAHDFVSRNLGWVKHHFSRPVHDLWHELRGESVFPVNPKQKRSYKSIMKSRTFRPTNDPAIIWKQLMTNLERACEKARRYDLVAHGLRVFLKSTSFEIESATLSLRRGSAYPNDIISSVRLLCRKLYNQRIIYRSTGVVLQDLKPDERIQTNFFEPVGQYKKMKNMYTAVDKINSRFGIDCVHLGGRGAGHTVRKAKGRLAIPFLQ